MADVDSSAYGRRDPATRKNRYLALYGALKSDRASFDSHWAELSDFLQPRRTRFWAGDRNRGDKRSQKIIDSTARFAARTLSSGLHAGLTSPARPWFKLTTPDPDLAKQAPVKAYLHEVTQRILTVFATTNLYNVLPIVYGDMGTFGTAAMSALDDPRDVFRSYAYPVGSYVLGLDARQIVSTFMREYQLTVRQVIEQFALADDKRSIDWSKVSPTVKALWDAGTYEAPVDVVWVVMPNEIKDAGRFGSKYLPFTSCYFEKGGGDDRFLRESGFNEFPIFAPRWDVAGEDTYGVDCPGMTALGDVKQLQIMQRKKGQAIAKMVDPPLQGPTALMTQKTSTLPGDVTYVDVRDGQQGLRSIHEIGLNLEHLVQDIGQTQYRIQRAYYEDLFLMLARSDGLDGSGQPITAREVEERHEEKLLALGPVLERTNDELLDPLVDRAFYMMLRAGLLPEAPELLHGVAIRPEYISIMAQAQKLVGVGAQDRMVQTVLGMAEMFPGVRAKINENRVIDNYADMLGVDPSIVRSDEEAKAITDGEAQAQQAAQAAEQAKNVGAAVKSAGTTPMEGDTALTRLIGSVTGAGAGGASLGGGG